MAKRRVSRPKDVVTQVIAELMENPEEAEGLLRYVNGGGLEELKNLRYGNQKAILQNLLSSGIEKGAQKAAKTADTSRTVMTALHNVANKVPPKATKVAPGMEIVRYAAKAAKTAGEKGASKAAPAAAAVAEKLGPKDILSRILGVAKGSSPAVMGLTGAAGAVGIADIIGGIVGQAYLNQRQKDMDFSLQERGVQKMDQTLNPEALLAQLMGPQEQARADMAQQAMMSMLARGRVANGESIIGG